MSEPDHRGEQRARAERAALDGIVQRLAQQFPELGRDEISNAVRGEYDGFQGSKIRDFVPILVERSARADLTHTAPRHRA
jgi:hypothetical protein